MSVKIAINGFGRIGRSFLRTIFDDPQAAQQIEVAAINVGPNKPQHLGHLFKYDSIMGTFSKDVAFENSILTINGKKIPVINEGDPRHIDWKKYDIEWVVEASGRFTSRECSTWHLESGAKKVLITAPAKDEDITIIPGVNDADYVSEKHTIISLGSCTTNCFAPIVKVLNDHFGIERGMMTTIHAYTNNQVLLDVEHKDPRRARAAALNIIPTKTGAANVILKLFPELDGKLFATSIRVPVPKVSLLDFSFVAKKPVLKETINEAFSQAAQNELSSIISYTDQPFVSSDFSNSTYSAIIDGQLTQATETMGKVFGWYDNEYGYACRVRDFLVSK
jgi:glyceraldehyde 3-phosphate dehydrogenase